MGSGWRTGIGMVGLAVLMAVVGWWSMADRPLAEPVPTPPTRRDPGRPAQPVPGAGVDGGPAAGARPTDRAGIIEDLRARGAGGPRPALPGSLGGSLGGEGSTLKTMVDRKADRTIRQLDLTMDDVRPLLKGEDDTIAELEGAIDRLDRSLQDVRKRLEDGSMTPADASQAMDAAKAEAADKVAELVDGEPAAMLGKALGRQEQPDDEEAARIWEGIPLEEWNPE